MHSRSIYLVFLLIACNFSIAQTMPTGRQVLPEPGSKLNYTQVMFEHAAVSGAAEYLVEVALREDSTFRHPVASRRDSSCATMISDLQWGKKYLWRYTGLNNGKVLHWYRPYDFEILSSKYTDGKNYRVRVLVNDSSANAGGLVMIDKMRSIIDRYGRCVWFLPRDTARQSAEKNLDSSPLDLRMTPQGTITMISGGRAEEIDLLRNVLWQAPKRSAFGIDSFNVGQPYRYHHSFKKLASGNYMVLDMKNIVKPVSSWGRHAAADTATVVMAYEVIREIDPSGRQVWNWSSENYFSYDELKTMALGRPDSTLINQEPGGHLNAFDVDEKNGFVYAGFRNVSRVVKIDKSTGKVVCAWGANMQYHGAENGDGFFFKQHDAALLRDGSIAVFNNNAAIDNPDESDQHKSSVVIFTQPTENSNSKLLWKYEFNFDSNDNLSPRGGGVDELKNGNLLVCMGTVNRIFEVTRDKKIVWSAAVERRNKTDSTWHPIDLYRAHYASSLYPCYFTIQSSNDTKSKTTSVFHLHIYNAGTEADSYVVDISSGKGYFKKHFSTAPLSAGKSLTLEIAADKPIGSSDGIHIVVTSNTNPDFIRSDFIH